MKSVWLIIAGVAAVWLWIRKRSDAPKAKGETVPAGTQIGQIGSRIENPQALTDFARSLAIQAEPRVLDVFTVGSRVYRTWTDGRYQILEGSSGSGTDPVTIYDDYPTLPSP